MRAGAAMHGGRQPCHQVPGRQQGRLAGGGMQAAEAGIVTYCTAKVMAEVSRVCADEMMATGRSECASLAYQQMEALLQQAAGAQASAEAFSQ